MSATYTRQPDGSIIAESVVQGRPPSPAERAQLNDAVGRMTDIFNGVPSEMWPSLIGSMFTTVCMAHPDPVVTGALLIETCGLSLSNAVRTASGHA
jgi:hypothetical protein